MSEHKDKAILRIDQSLELFSYPKEAVMFNLRLITNICKRYKLAFLRAQDKNAANEATTAVEFSLFDRIRKKFTVKKKVKLTKTDLPVSLQLLKPVYLIDNTYKQ